MAVASRLHIRGLEDKDNFPGWRIWAEGTGMDLSVEPMPAGKSGVRGRGLLEYTKNGPLGGPYLIDSDQPR